MDIGSKERIINSTGSPEMPRQPTSLPGDLRELYFSLIPCFVVCISESCGSRHLELQGAGAGKDGVSK